MSISLIKNATSLGINYSASSSSADSIEYLPEKVFSENDFRSQGSLPDQWWQISFSAFVAIESYTISAASSNSYRPKSWSVSSSFDNKTWEFVHIMIGQDTNSNTKLFNLPNVINCKHFRITMKENFYSYSPYRMIFNKFDCFGKLGKKINNKLKCFCSSKSRGNGLAAVLALSLMTIKN